MRKAIGFLLFAIGIGFVIADPPIIPGGGGVQIFQFQNGNGFTGTVTNPRTAPLLSLTYAAAQPKTPVSAASTGSNVTLSGTQTVDGFTATPGHRILVKDQTNGTQNGIYDSQAGAWTRSGDSNTGNLLVNASTLVLNGAVNMNLTFQCNTPAPITIGTTIITFVQTSPSFANFAQGAGTLSVSSTNNYAIPQHTHAITSSANPGAGASLLSSDSSGDLAVTALGINKYPPVKPLDLNGDAFIDETIANIFMKDLSTGFQVANSGIVTPQSGNTVENTSFSSGVSGWDISDVGNVEFNNGLFRGELRASVFRVSEITATAGTFGVFFSACALHDNTTTPGSTGNSFTFNGKNSDAGGSLLAVNDIVRMKGLAVGGVADAWALITAFTPSGSFTTYTATLEFGSTNATFVAGTAVVDYGPSGTGFITLSADGTIGSSPNLTMATHSGSPWSSQTLRLREGNLNGSYGYGSTTYGIGLGPYGSSGGTWQTFDDANGIRQGNNVSTMFQIDTSGDVTLGQVSANQGNAYWNNTTKTLQFRGGSGGTTVEAYINTDGSIGAGGNPQQVTINHNGISILSPSVFGLANTITWLSGASASAQLFNTNNASASYTDLTSATTTGNGAEVDLQAASGSKIVTEQLAEAGNFGFASFNNNGTFSGLNVGASGSPNHMIDAHGEVWAQTVGASSSTTIIGVNPPILSTDTCEAGSIAWNSSFIFVCTSTNTWKRVALSSF